MSYRALIAILAVRFRWLAALLPTPIPVVTRRLPYRQEFSAQTLIVCLPGIADGANDFYKEGFIEALHASGVQADVLLVDMHFGYYANETMIQRLHEDVFLPAHAAGYKSSWLVGISLGGFGALVYAHRHPSEITGIVTIAPYLGRATLIDEIASAGGIGQWSPRTDLRDDYEREVWRWLKTECETTSRLPRLWLAYGRRDKFVRAHEILHRSLPANQVVVTSGGHNWNTWQGLWRQILLSQIFREPIRDRDEVAQLK